MRAVGVRRRAVMLTLALASLALGPVIYAAATPSGPAAATLPSLTGTITKVDLAHRVLVVKVTKAVAKYKGKAVTLNLKASPPGATSVTRLGHTGKLVGLKKNDRVVVTYKLNAANKPVAVKITDSGPAPVINPSLTPTPTVTSPTATETTSPPAGPPTSSTTPSPADPNTIVLKAENYDFTPQPITIKVGQTLKFVVSGTHSWTSGASGTADHAQWDDSGILSGSQTFTYVFSTTGTYPFFCKVHYATHPSMSGTITVVPAS